MSADNGREPGALSAVQLRPGPCGASLDHLVREQENRSRHGHGERLSGFQINHELETSRPLNRLLRRIGTLKYLARQRPRLAEEPWQVRAVGEKPTHARELRKQRNRGKPMREAEISEELQIAREERRRQQ